MIDMNKISKGMKCKLIVTMPSSSRAFETEVLDIVRAPEALIGESLVQLRYDADGRARWFKAQTLSFAQF